MPAVPSTTRILARLTATVWAVVCVTLLTLWALSRSHALAYGRASGTQSWHAAVREDTIWLSRVSEWSDAAAARDGARVAPGARPLISIRRFDVRVGLVTQARDFLIAHAAQLRGHNGPDDPEAAAEERAARDLTTRFHDDLRRSSIPPADPLVAYSTVDVRQTWGVTFEGAWVHAPPDYGPPVLLRAIGIPCWLVAVALGLWPSAAMARHFWRAHRARCRARRRRCPACGYDLRATADPDGPTLARCPECGVASAASTDTEPAEVVR